jgi:iron complex transport system substrate-binding protein
MRQTRLTPFAAAAAATLALSACGGAAAGDSAADGETVSWTWQRNTAGEDEEPALEETTVEVPKNPEKIVSFDMASLDTIAALGSEVDGAPLENVPEYLQDGLAEDAFDAGTLFEADLTAIEAQEPDLIIIGGRSAALYDDLSEIAPTIDLGLADGFTETLERNTTFLGEVLGAEDKATTELAKVNAGIAEAKAVAEKAGTGLGILVTGGKVNAMAPSSEGGGARAARGGLIYDAFGVQPAVEDVKAATHGEPVSFEFLLEHNPDYLWVVDRDAATGGVAEDGTKSQPAAQVLDNEVVAKTTAAQKDQIVYLDPQAWYVVFGGLETTQKMIDDVLQIQK